MKTNPYLPRQFLIGALLFVTIAAHAGINSGGGIGKVGGLCSFGSIGSPFAAGVRTVGTLSNRTGLVEVLVPWHTNSAVQDTDGDGMSDAWEVTAGLNPNVSNGTADSDHDGMTDYQEFVTGTLPLVAGSRFSASASVETGGVRIQCPTLARRKYRIEYSPNLIEWHLSEEVAGDGIPLNRLVPLVDGQPRGFYHIIVTMHCP